MAVRQLVRGFDALLAQYYGIREFTDDPDCIMRIALARAEREIVLSDGTTVRADDAVIDLHWWNERLPRIPPQGPDAAWATSMRRHIVLSLRSLARHMSNNPELDPIRALRAEIVFGTRVGRPQLVRFARHFGFDLVERRTNPGLGGQLHLAGDSILLWGLIWAYNPRGLKHKPLLRERSEVWISRTAFLGRTGGAAAKR